MDNHIRDDIQQEAVRIVSAGQARGVVLRLLGGLAIRLHAPSAGHPALLRAYQDMDFAAARGQSRAVEDLLASLGYQPDKAFNLLNGATRLLFYDQTHNRQVDVFVGQFEMCHRVPIAERLDHEPLTLPLAELLLTKLQIVQINDKDVRDICALVLDHPVGQTDDETLNARRIGQICGEDWGLWKTASLSLHKLRDALAAYDLQEAERRTIVERVDALLQAMDAAPKSLKWKMRAAIGERVQWYELPEEVRRD